MTFATPDATQVREVPLRAFAPGFAKSFERASERRVRTLYDIVARTLSVRFSGLAAAATDQLDVLNSIGALVGLKGLDVDQPLADEAGEELAQRMAWRTAARWAVLSLLWALVDRRSEPMTYNEWAQLASEHGGKRPRSRSSLPEADEPTALGWAAHALVSSPALTEGTGMAVLGVPLVICAREGDQVLARAVRRPIALVETGNDWSAPRMELSAGDRVLLAADSQPFSLSGDYESPDDATRTLTSRGSLELEAGTQVIGVARGRALLFDGESLE
jgi:hypothetical protein